MERVDRAAIMEQFAGNTEIFALVAEAFLAQYREQLVSVGQSLANHDPGALARSAHKLKGSVSIFRSAPAVEAAATLEHCGATGHLDDADETYRRLRDEVELVGETLRHMLRETVR